MYFNRNQNTIFLKQLKFNYLTLMRNKFDCIQTNKLLYSPVVVGVISGHVKATQKKKINK